MDNQTYTINIGTFSDGTNTYNNRCLSASFGGQGIPSETIPWEGTDYNPWDFKYEDGEFVLDRIEMPSPVSEPTELEQLRADVDYLLMLEE